MVTEAPWRTKLKTWRRDHEESYARTILEEPVKKTLSSLIRMPACYIVMGERGGGKSAMAHQVVSDYHQHKDVPACLHLPGIPDKARKRIQKMLPTWFRVTTRRSQWPEHCIVVYDEAAQTAHARRSQSGQAVELDDLLGITRQRDQTILFIAHHSRKLDINVIHEVNGIIWKRPTYAHQMWERSELADFSMRAYDFFQTKLGPLPHTKARRRKAMEAGLMLDLDDFRLCQFTNSLPSWWTEDLSCVFRDLDLRGKKGGATTE